MSSHPNSNADTYTPKESRRLRFVGITGLALATVVTLGTVVQLVSGSSDPAAGQVAVHPRPLRLVEASFETTDGRRGRYHAEVEMSDGAIIVLDVPNESMPFWMSDCTWSRFPSYTEYVETLRLYRQDIQDPQQEWIVMECLELPPDIAGGLPRPGLHFAGWPLNELPPSNVVRWLAGS